ncbi:hypothetical protein DFH11DRAFT_1757718 [Phellopilus nigrolimitatus]|nr:hypothetical protein DFH11DRAFT_1757718 [Phellopilus nigrolimitatus]
MRVKQVWEIFPLPANLKLFWDRVTFSRITKFYFLFSVLHCLAQVTLQIQAFSFNAQAANFLWHLVTQGNAADPGFAVLTEDGLRFCEDVPSNLSAASCQLIWSALASKNDTGRPDSGASNSASISSSSLRSVTTLPASTTSDLSVTITEPATNSVSPFASSTRTSGSSVTLSQSSAISTPAISSGEKEGDDDEETEEEEEDDSDDEDSDDEDSDDEGDVDEDELEKRGKRDNTDFVRVKAVDTNGSTVVQINGFGFKNRTVTLSQKCLFTLNWPVEKLDNTKREDITFIAFQFWVLGMSIVAILNESMPHIIASLLTHVLATAWGGYQISSTSDFRMMFNRLTTNGACGINLLSTYWKDRAAAEIPSLVLNAVALLLSAFLSWKLVKLFGWQTFKRVGASRTVNRVYKLVLTLSIAIQLSLFFIVAAIGLWIDALSNGAVGRLATNSNLYKGVMIAVLLLLLPWLAMGWFAVRRELKVTMLFFLVMSFGYLGGWGAMFASPSFRWTFVLWRFFSLITSASVFLTLITVVLGLMCRVNFGKGLPRYLNAEEPLSDDFIPAVSKKQRYEDEEKIEFPSGRAALPSYSVAFGRGDEVPPPSRMKFGPPRLGPRFTNPSLEPFEQQLDESNAQVPSIPATQTTYSKALYSEGNAMSTTAAGTNGSTLYGLAQPTRPLSIGSQRSYASYGSDSSATKSQHSNDGNN